MARSRQPLAKAGFFPPSRRSGERFWALALAGLIALIMMMTAGRFAAAHFPGISQATLKLKPNNVEIQFVFSLSDIETLIPIDIDGDGGISADEFDGARGTLNRLSGELALLKIDGVQLGHSSKSARVDQGDGLKFFLNYPYAGDLPLELSVPVLQKFLFGHRMVVSVENDLNDAVTQYVLSASDPRLEIAHHK